jgi:FKBP-type peptidyl-prolyl cis-trans isomerase
MRAFVGAPSALSALFACTLGCTNLTAPPSPEAIASETPSSTAAPPKAQAATAPPTASAPPVQAPARNPNDKVAIKEVAPGAGPAAKDGDTVSVLYTGKLQDGTVFDSSAKNKNQPFTFTLGKGGAIEGWQQGISGMKKGGKRQLTIPPSLAYGDRGVPGRIPPNSTLVFDVELKSIGAKK